VPLVIPLYKYQLQRALNDITHSNPFGQSEFLREGFTVLYLVSEIFNILTEYRITKNFKVFDHKLNIVNKLLADSYPKHIRDPWFNV